MQRHNANTMLCNGRLRQPREAIGDHSHAPTTRCVFARSHVDPSEVTHLVGEQAECREELRTAAHLVGLRVPNGHESAEFLGVLECERPERRADVAAHGLGGEVRVMGGEHRVAAADEEVVHRRQQQDRQLLRLGCGAQDVEHLVVVGRALDATGPEAALRALVAGPTPAELAAGLGTEIPAETTVRWVEVAGDEITVDLSGPFELGGGSLSMFLRIGEVVFTATQFEGIDVVRFRIDGMPVDMIGGEGLMVDHATRLQFADAVAPMILLESPLPGASFVEPIHLRGMSNTFEAVVNYQVLDAGGRVILESRCMATSGTGTWGKQQRSASSFSGLLHSTVDREKKSRTWR